MMVDVLGVAYDIVFRDEKEDEYLEQSDGYCDTSIKQIVIKNYKPSIGSLADLNYYANKIIRHELIHAFLYESGLSCNSDWACNEELVDWIALQFPRLSKAFEQSADLYKQHSESGSN